MSSIKLLHFWFMPIDGYKRDNRLKIFRGAKKEVIFAIYAYTLVCLQLAMHAIEKQHEEEDA